MKVQEHKEIRCADDATIPTQQPATRTDGFGLLALQTIATNRGFRCRSIRLLAWFAGHRKPYLAEAPSRYVTSRFDLLQFDQRAQALFKPLFGNTNSLGIELTDDFGQDKRHLSPLRANERQDAFVDE